MRRDTYNMNPVTRWFRCVLCSVAMVCAVTAAGVAQTAQNEQMASYYFQNGEYDKAVELYEPLYNKTQNQYYYQMLYSSYLKLERYKEAVRLVEKRMKKNGRDLTLWVDLGDIYLMQNDNRKASKTFAEAIDRVGIDQKQTESLALAFESRGFLSLSLQTYLTSRTRTHNDFLYVMEIAALYCKQGDYEKMADEYFALLDKVPGMMGSVQIALQRALSESSDGRLADGLRRSLTAKVRQMPDSDVYLEMMIWFSMQQKDFKFALSQAKAVCARFPKKGEGQVYRVAQIARNNEDFDVAEDGYRYLINRGKESDLYMSARIGELDVRFARLNDLYVTDRKLINALEEDYKSTIDELGLTPLSVPLVRNYAHLLAYRDNKIQEASDLLYDIIEMPRLAPSVMNEVKIELGDLLLFAGEVWEASLLYGQVEKANKNDVIGSVAKLKNAKLSYYNNDFQWAKSQLDVLRASTSKLVANDAMRLSLIISDNMEMDSTFDMLELYAAADLLLYRNMLDSAWSKYTEIEIRTLSHPLLDEVAMQKAQICIKQGRYTEADSLMAWVADHYSADILADEALFMRAELNEKQLGKSDVARQCYERLILDYPGSLYIDRARKKYNLLNKL